MDLSGWEKAPPTSGASSASGAMRVPAVMYAERGAAARHGRQGARAGWSMSPCCPASSARSYAMPDAHWGYGFPIGGVAAFDSGSRRHRLGGRRRLRHFLRRAHAAHRPAARAAPAACSAPLADELFRAIPAGVGQHRPHAPRRPEMDAMLTGGARWAVGAATAIEADLERIEEHGQMLHAKPGCVSAQAKRRQRDEMGTLGSRQPLPRGAGGDAGLRRDDRRGASGSRSSDVVVMHPLRLARPGPPDRHRLPARDGGGRAAPRHPPAGPRARLRADPVRHWARRYLGAMRAAINCALANRQILTHLVRAGPSPGSCPRRDLRAALRRLAQHLQGRGRTSSTAAANAVRASQGRDARLRPGHPELPAGVARRRPAGADRRLDGHGLVRARRRRQRRSAGLQLGLPRRRPRHESRTRRRRRWQRPPGRATSWPRAAS